MNIAIFCLVFIVSKTLLVSAFLVHFSSAGDFYGAMSCDIGVTPYTPLPSRLLGLTSWSSPSQSQGGSLLTLSSGPLYVPYRSSASSGINRLSFLSDDTDDSLRCDRGGTGCPSVYLNGGEGGSLRTDLWSRCVSNGGGVYCEARVEH